jgi:hypothetical protein
MLVDVLKYNHGLGSKLSLFPMLANVGGMACVGLFIRRATPVAWCSLPIREKKRVLVIALVDAASGVLLMTGLVVVGGGIFVLLYSLVPFGRRCWAVSASSACCARCSGSASSLFARASA